MLTDTGIRAPRGRQLSCKSWHQEAALRMLMNNLDTEVAERPQDLIVYGGSGKAARNWESYHAIVSALRELENDETLLVQSGKPVGIFKTHEYSPRVLIANSNLVGHWANWEEFRRLEALGVGAFLYAVLFTIEGMGLWRGKRWAEYLTVIATLSLVPLELFELIRAVTPARVAALVVNFAVAAYLIWRISRAHATRAGDAGSGAFGC